MISLQYVQVIGNSILSIIAFCSFIIIANYLRLTKNKCEYNAGDFFSYDCSAYHSLQANAAFSFFLILVPAIGILGSFQGKKLLTIIYLIALSIILLVYVITCIIVLSNESMRDYWREARHTDCQIITAVMEGLMECYNMCIAQIILIWFFLVGTGIITFISTKNKSEGIQEPLNN